MNAAVGVEAEYDVVVLGAGAAGMTAAFVAAREGLRVLLIEKSAQVGGSTSRAAGTVWIPGNFTFDSSSAREDIDAARKYLDLVVGEDSPALMREQYLAHGPTMLAYLQQYSAVRFQACPVHSDYYPDVPGAKRGGRPVEATVYDGRRLGGYFDALRSPLREFMVFDGMMVSKADIDTLLGARSGLQNFIRTTALLARYARDRLQRYSRGTRLTMGNALCARLLRSIIDAGVVLRLSTEVTDIRKCTDNSHSVTLSCAGQQATVNATRGLIFAGGGFSASAGWRKRYLPEPIPTMTTANESNDASTLELALRMGAVTGSPREDRAWWFPVSVVPRRDGSTGVFPHIVMDRAKPGMLAVGRHGQRFVNEGVNYHEFARAQYRTGAVPCWFICDSQFIHRYGLGAVRPGAFGLTGWVKRGYLTRADTIESLADSIGIDSGGLVLSVQRMNEFARSGEDIDFGKGRDELSRQNGDQNHKPNPCLGSIAIAPFYAMEIVPADLGTSLGLLTNQDAQLVDATGAVLPGLYACGNDMNSIMGGHYPAPGVTIGPAMTFGYLAARHLAGDHADCAKCRSTD